MPAHLHEENEWQYWLSRSMEAEGQLKWVADTAGATVRVKVATMDFSPPTGSSAIIISNRKMLPVLEIDEDTFLSENPHMLRARELFYLDRLVDAKREWFQALRYLDQDQMKQAATLASKWQWHDSAIRTVAKTPHRSDYSLRFPMPYKQQVLEHAQARELDPSLIYGVMRRESLFDPLARSSVGSPRTDATNAEHRAQCRSFAGDEKTAQIGHFTRREQYPFRHPLPANGDEPLRQQRRPRRGSLQCRPWKRAPLVTERQCHVGRPVGRNGAFQGNAQLRTSSVGLLNCISTNRSVKTP